MFPQFVVHAQGVKEWGDCVVDNVPTLKCAEVVFGNLLFMSGVLIVLVLFIMFLIGGFNYLTSFGSPDKVKKAQSTLRYAVIGFVLYISAFLILKTIDVIFLGNQGRIFKFEIQAPTPTP
jgi:hypothetical protein